MTQSQAPAVEQETAEFSLDSALCFALYSSVQATMGIYRELLAPWGLTYQQYIALTVLWQRGAVTIGELAESLRLDASTVSGLVRRLERDGLVAKVRDAADQRVVRVSCTGRGHELREETSGVPACVATAMTGGTAEGVAQAGRLIDELHRLRETLTTPVEPLSAP